MKKVGLAVLLAMWALIGSCRRSAFRFAAVLLFTVMVCGSAVADNALGVPDSEYKALVALYNSTNGQNWRDNSGWLTSNPGWGGVTVSGGHVTELWLYGNQLTGTIPAELGNLTNLCYLDLNYNQLTGAIPPELGSLTDLQGLHLCCNQLTGTIPAELGNLTNLCYLDLYDNQLTGAIPPELGSLTDLQGLYLYSNQLTGTIPPQLGNITNLHSLELDCNQLTGTIPPQLGNITNLDWLGLGANQLTGTIPPELGSLTDLQGLYLYSNQLTGTIPPQLGNITNLHSLELGANQLTGTIPAELGNLTNLCYLDLYDNQLTGAIPPELGSLTDLQALYLYSNQLTGTIPPELGNLTNLQGLSLSGNRLTGMIPTSVANLISLSPDWVKSISYNGLWAADPTLLAFLDNKFSGWKTTQTVPPAEVSASVTAPGSVEVSWTPILYTADAGYYEVGFSQTSGGPYTPCGRTADKLASSITVSGLPTDGPLYFVVRTVTLPSANNQNKVTSLWSMSPGGITLTLSPDTVTIGQTVTATAYAQGATSVRLSFSVPGAVVPGIDMTSSDNDTWTATINTSFLAATRATSVMVTATAPTASGQVLTGSATLYIGSAPPQPEPPGTTLRIYNDDTNAYGLATSSFTYQNLGSVPLDAMVTVAQDLNLWFEVVGSCSGAASWSIAPLSSNPADVLGHFCMISPSGTVNEIGHFTQQGDSLTLSLRFATPKAAVANLANVLLAVVPGGATADPQNVVQVLQDLNAIKSVSDAGQELFSSGAHTPSQWAKAAGHALWDMKGLLSDDAQRTALAAVFAQIGVNATAEEIGSIVQVLSVYDLLKILSSEIVGICQTGCHDINSTFKAYNGGGVGASAMTSVLSAGRLRASSSSAQATVTWTTTPSATDWLINYSVTDQGSAPVWNFGVFYEPSVGAPLQVTAPAGWTYEVDSAVGTVTWYCQGPNGWTNGDFGSAVILPGNSLSGFTIRHTCPPDYSVSCSTDTGYTTAYNTVMTPAPALGIASAKLGTECIQEVINDGIVSAVLPNNVYYVEDSNRACGIRVSGGPTPNIGDKVRIAGTITAQSGEAQINATSCAVSGTGSVATLGIPNKLLGGGAFDTQRGVTGGFGLNNIGLLVRTWGKVTQIGTDHLYINDGSNLKDGTSTGSEQNIGIRVICDSTGYQSGQYIAVTGISSCFKTDSDALARRILTRSQQDIQVIGLQ